MISVASTLLLVSMVFGTVPAAWAAPVGTRNLDVRSIRRMDARELTGMRREHHSATSVVPGDADVPVPVVARAGAPEPVQPDPTTEEPSPSKPKMRRHHAKNQEKGADAKPRAMPRFKRDAIPRRESASNPEVVARKEDATSSNIAREDETVKRAPVGTGSVEKDPKSDAEKRDVPAASPRHPVTEPKPVDPTKRDAPAVDPAESSTPKVASRHHHGGNGPKDGMDKKDPSTEAPGANPGAKREEVKEETATKREETKPIKPIAIFRRALAFEDLD